MIVTIEDACYVVVVVVVVVVGYAGVVVAGVVIDAVRSGRVNDPIAYSLGFLSKQCGVDQRSNPTRVYLLEVNVRRNLVLLKYMYYLKLIIMLHICRLYKYII